MGADEDEDRRAASEEASGDSHLWRVLDRSLNEIYMFRPDDLRFEYANAGALRNLGFTLAQMRTMTPVDVKPEHTEASFRAMVAPLLSGTAEKLVFKTAHRRADGSTYPVEVHLQLVPHRSRRVFLAIINDITERERSEKRLRESEERFRAMIERSRDLICLIDARGLLTFVSPAVTEVLGYAPEDVVGRPARELVHPEDVARYASSLAGESPTPLEQDLVRVRHRDGGWRTLEVYARNLKADPSVGAYVLNARDVTEKLKLEEQFRQAQKLESIGRLAGGVAHDFNNILTVILGCVEMLEPTVRAAGPQSLAELEEIRQAGERARELTRQLLAFARRQVISPRTVDLNELVRQSEHFLERVLGEDIELRMHLEEGLWPIRVDPSQVEQVILNLAVNARDAMQNGGRLTIETANVTLDAESLASHPDVTAGQHVVLVVSDTGVGIPAENVPRLFEPFFTTKEAGKGTGLGLSTLYGIVRQLGGHVWVHSEPGIGTTFKVHFPRSVESVRSPEVPAPPPTASSGHERVLVVEDERVVRELVARTLTGAGYAVLVAENADEALKLVREHGDAIDLLLTDVIMPGMSGTELARRLLQEHPHLRVLYVSGYTESALLHPGALDEGVRLLAKPFTPTGLREQVRRLLDAPR